MICVVTPGPAQQQNCAQLNRVAAEPARSLAQAAQPDVLADLRALLAAADDCVVIVSGHVLLHDEALAELVLDPRRRTAAAVSNTSTSDVRRRGGQIVSAGSPHHTVSDPDGVFAGVLVVSREDASRAARAVSGLATCTGAGSTGDLLASVLVALVRSGVRVAAADIDPWPWVRVVDIDDATSFGQQVAALDVSATKLARALRPDDGFYSTFVVRKLSRRLTPLALRLRLRPNHITVVSLLIGVLAAVSFAAGGRIGLVTGALLLQLSLVVDCVDGEVARYTRAFTSLGAWLDASTDRIKEYACYAGLAFSATADGRVDPWLLASAMLSLQTTRHTTDYTFTLVKNVREGAAISLPLDQRTDVHAHDTQASVALRAVRASERSNERSAIRWAKKAMYLPIGERWLVISVAAAFGSAYWVFGSLLTLGCLAFAYTTGARALRARTWTAQFSTDLEREVVRAQLDRGPLASAIAHLLPWRLPAGRLAWTVPPMLRAIEFMFVVLTMHLMVPDAMPAAFALLFVVAYHHYDALYRVLNGLPSAGALRAAGLGIEGRMLLIAGLALSGPTTLARGLVVLAVVLGFLFLGVGTAGGLRAMRTARAPRVPETTDA